jgi:2TM domain-containing protein
VEDITTHPHYQDARRHARQVRGFYVHALVFVLVNAGLVAINLLLTPGRIWFGWGLAGWAVGLAAHGLSVFAFGGWLGRDWEERKIREYLDRRA